METSNEMNIEMWKRLYKVLWYLPLGRILSFSYLGVRSHAQAKANDYKTCLQSSGSLWHYVVKRTHLLV